MSDNKSSFRIDWFDGTVIEDARSNDGAFATESVDNVEQDVQVQSQTKPKEMKPIGFKRLLDISMMDPPVLNLELNNRVGFWYLLDAELKDDYIVLIVRALSKLYKSLEPGEKSMTLTLLRNKFENSSFLEVLRKYIEGLPFVRIMEKRMNSHLWDDIQSFFKDVLYICEGVVQCSNHKDLLFNIKELLPIIEASITGVKEEHSERFSDDLFLKISEMNFKFNGLNEKSKEGPSASSSSDKRYNYKYLSIFPNRDDLMGINKIHIKPNLINGAYPDVEHYLDVQFKLLREDCFRPLREGICKYMENPSKRRYENIRVHPKVRIIRNYVSKNKLGHLIDIAWYERSYSGQVDCRKYALDKHLMFGSLLLLTCDNYNTILCATVLDSSIELLSEGYIAVSFHNPISKTIFDQQYVMIESEVFFEPYHRVLKVLQNFKPDIPMRRYIVDVETLTRPPEYLNEETIYSVLDNKTREEIYFPVLEESQWPIHDSLGLDESQSEAYRHALTREFSVIQGPPGTGKTFFGVKIVSTLLRNLSLEGTPMLIICYTNHALDQFLEGILSVTSNVVRLGSQSKSKVLEPYNLNNLRKKMKSKYSYMYANKRSKLENIFKEMTELQTEIEKCEKNVLTYDSIKAHFNIGNKVYELKKGKEDPMLNFLFSHLVNETELSDCKDNEDSNAYDEDNWESKFDDLEKSSENNKLEACFSEQWALKEMASLRNSVKYVQDITDDHVEGQKMSDKFENQICNIRNRLDYFKKHAMKLVENLTEDLKINKVSDIYNLNPEQRWNLYISIVKKVKNKLTLKMNALLEIHNTCTEELNEIASLIDSEAMKHTRVVGVTTTTAARRHDLLKKLLSPIVIVEEAAEVLEAHIVASLTNGCKHLILIGDHKQLRPRAAHYELAKHHNLEISLFERMIRNGVHSRTLSVQRRMRPEFVELLVPAVYDRLTCHPIVYAYPNVTGMKDNLYFFSHEELEDTEGLEDSWSYKNTIEAKWCVALCNYLRQMKYSAEDVTILATYTGQANIIKELSEEYALLRDVKITVVDNYQGEESRIVILSLVRSNKAGNIGFLSAQNRICVALSRAKEGFYIFGNMNILKGASPIWRTINNKLIDLRAIGNTITVSCRKHPDKFIEIKNVDDFENCLSDECLKICDNCCISNYFEASGTSALCLSIGVLSPGDTSHSSP